MILLVGTLGINFRKMHLKMPSRKWQPFCLGLNVLKKLFLIRADIWVNSVNEIWSFHVGRGLHIFLPDHLVIASKTTIRASGFEDGVNWWVLGRSTFEESDHTYLSLKSVWMHLETVLMFRSEFELKPSPSPKYTLFSKGTHICLMKSLIIMFPVCPIWFQDPVFEMLSWNPVRFCLINADNKNLHKTSIYEWWKELP